MLNAQLKNSKTSMSWYKVDPFLDGVRLLTNQNKNLNGIVSRFVVSGKWENFNQVQTYTRTWYSRDILYHQVSVKSAGSKLILWRLRLFVE